MDSLLAEFTDLAERDAYSAFQGDYALLGHCAGALVAYEIAKLLPSPAPIATAEAWDRRGSQLSEPRVCQR